MWPRPQHIADLFKPGAKGIVEQVGVALRGLDLRVAEELADHRQRHAARLPQRILADIGIGEERIDS